MAKNNAAALPAWRRFFYTNPIIILTKMPNAFKESVFGRFFAYIWLNLLRVYVQKKNILHFFAEKFAHVKKKLYLCAIFRVIVRRIPEFEEKYKYILQCQKFVKLQARKPWADATFRTRSVTPNARLM